MFKKSMSKRGRVEELREHSNIVPKPIEPNSLGNEDDQIIISDNGEDSMTNQNKDNNNKNDNGNGDGNGNVDVNVNGSSGLGPKIFHKVNNNNNKINNNTVNADSSPLKTKKSLMKQNSSNNKTQKNDNTAKRGRVHELREHSNIVPKPIEPNISGIDFQQQQQQQSPKQTNPSKQYNARPSTNTKNIHEAKKAKKAKKPSSSTLGPKLFSPSAGKKKFTKPPKQQPSFSSLAGPPLTEPPARATTANARLGPDYDTNNSYSDDDDNDDDNDDDDNDNYNNHDEINNDHMSKLSPGSPQRRQNTPTRQNNNGKHKDSKTISSASSLAGPPLTEPPTRATTANARLGPNHDTNNTQNNDIHHHDDYKNNSVATNISPASLQKQQINRAKRNNHNHQQSPPTIQTKVTPTSKNKRMSPGTLQRQRLRLQQRDKNTDNIENSLQTTTLPQPPLFSATSSGEQSNLALEKQRISPGTLKRRNMRQRQTNQNDNNNNNNNAENDDGNAQSSPLPQAPLLFATSSGEHSDIALQKQRMSPGTNPRPPRANHRATNTSTSQNNSSPTTMRDIVQRKVLQNNMDTIQLENLGDDGNIENDNEANNNNNSNGNNNAHRQNPANRNGRRQSLRRKRQQQQQKNRKVVTDDVSVKTNDDTVVMSNAKPTSSFSLLSDHADDSTVPINNTSYVEDQWESPGAVDVTGWGRETRRTKGTLAEQPTGSRTNNNNNNSSSTIPEVNEGEESDEETGSLGSKRRDPSSADQRFKAVLIPGILPCICCCIVLIIVIIVVAVVTSGKKKHGDSNDDKNNSDKFIFDSRLIPFRDYIQDNYPNIVSSDSNWNSADTPQYKALSWLGIADTLSKDMLPLVSSATNKSNENQPDIVLQRYIMAVWYFAMNGGAWTSSVNWLFEEQPECIWEYISCDTNGFITEYGVSDFINLIGTIPTNELRYLTKLRNLTIVKNQIDADGITMVVGPLPSTLESLTLNAAGLMTWPESLWELSQLTLLNLDRNEIKGSLPNEIRALSNLETLSIRGNLLTGDPSAIFQTMPLLTELWISSNDFTGNIGSLVGRHETMCSTTTCAGLKTLALSSNSLTGQFDMTWLGYVSESLEYLQLGQNGLSSQLGTEIGLLTKLIILNVENNELTGPIPTEIGLLTNISELYFGQNQFTGSLPTELGQMENLARLRITNNLEITGNLPSEIGNSSKLGDIHITFSKMSGMIPSEIGLLSNSLTSLNLPSNRFTGPIPAEISNLGKLTYIDLIGNNGLSGIIPEAVCDFSDLGLLRVPENVDCTCDKCQP